MSASEVVIRAPELTITAGPGRIKRGRRGSARFDSLRVGLGGRGGVFVFRVARRSAAVLKAPPRGGGLLFISRRGSRTGTRRHRGGGTRARTCPAPRRRPGPATPRRGGG